MRQARQELLEEIIADTNEDLAQYRKEVAKLEKLIELDVELINECIEELAEIKDILKVEEFYSRRRKKISKI